ncbi:MAG: hypothetical protein LQ339_006856 [Xanthoria mediterranea]|nr:MAG: hypothetical protein LQ339_006856 [Xanthoria mediterranea]
MVYVALGFVIASLCSVCYAYKHVLWPTVWPTSKKVQTLPEISFGTVDPPHPNDPSSTDEPGAERSKIAGTRGLAEGSTGEDEITPNGTRASSTQDGTRQYPRPAMAEPESSPAIAAPSGHVKAFNARNPELASSVVNGTPKTSMPPPARPGPRLRTKATKSMAPSSNPQPRNNSSLGVPQTASTLRPLPSGGASALHPPPSLASTLRNPPSRSLATPTSSLAPTSSTLPTSARPSKKVLLSPGHSPLDWAHLTSHPPSPTYLRGADVPSGLIRVTPSLLKNHNGRKGKNAWGVWQGKVYNLTPYMNFHPGGVDELMKGAGREKDGERLFLEVHPWVNWENMLGECLVGILVSEEEALKDGNGLEDMD